MFVHLHCHSHYSFLRGVASPEEIIAAAVEQKMPAVALTDTNGLYAAVSFYQAAKKTGIQPILGVVLDVECAPPSFRAQRDRFLSARLLRREISLRWIPEQNQYFGHFSSFCQAKEGERQRSTPPPELPIGRAASIRTSLSSRKRVC